MNVTGLSRGLDVTADGEGVVSHAGLVLLRQLADQSGLTGGLSGALASERLLIHDRGRVLADLACAIADGSEVISDFRVLADQKELFGLVASVPTTWRTLSEIATGGPETLGRISAAVHTARCRAWAAGAARHGGLPGVRIADKVLEGVTCIRLDATVTAAYADKEWAQPNFTGFGHHPLLSYCDNTGEPLAGMMRRGGAGSNTVADHLRVLEEAIAALPPEHRRQLMVSCDGAGASHGLIARLDELAARPGYQLTYSVGWDLGARERTAISRVPEGAWQVAIDHRGAVRERRAEDACPRPQCGHERCWVEQAHVTELTGLLRDGPGADQLAGWPPSMRVFARRERPHPGAQLSLFETTDGWRYSLWVTNLPTSQRGWRANPASIDAAHRVHARVEDARPHRERLRNRPLSLARFRDQLRLAGRLVDRGHPAGLAAAAGPGRRPGPRRTENPALQDLARRRPADPQRPTPPAENLPNLALGHRDHHRLDPPQHPAPSPLTSTKPPPRSRKEQTRDPWNPRPPGPLAGTLSYPDPKIKILNEAQRPSQTTHRSRRMIKARRAVWSIG